MSAADLLRASLEVLSDKGKWAKDGIAFDMRGNEVSPKSGKAVSFCLVGAVQKPESTVSDYSAAILALKAQCGGMSVFEFNDNHGHRAVLKCIRKAILAVTKEVTA